MLDIPPEYRVKDLSIGWYKNNRKLYDNITRHLSKMKFTSYVMYKNGPSRSSVLLILFE